MDVSVLRVINQRIIKHTAAIFSLLLIQLQGFLTIASIDLISYFFLLKVFFWWLVLRHAAELNSLKVVTVISKVNLTE